MKKLLIILVTSIALLYTSIIYAGIVELKDEGQKLSKVSITLESGSSDLAENINDNGFKILKSIKGIVGGVLLIFMVYIGVSMILSMGSDEEKLSSSKRQLRYVLIAILFINIPGTLFESFHKGDSSSITVDERTTGSTWKTDSSDENIIVSKHLKATVNDNIIGFMKVFIGYLAVAVIIFAGFKLLTARGREEQVTEAKNKIIYSIAGLVFLGISDVWRNIAFTGNIQDGKNLFEQLGNLALFFAGPIAIFFLMIAGYYFITSNGDDEKVKKAKSIVVNTILATVILLASYTLLLDLATL